MKNEKRLLIPVVLITSVLLIGTVFSGMIVFGDFEEDKSIILVYSHSEEEVEELKNYGDIIDHYGRNVLLETSENYINELKGKYEVNALEHRNELILRGYEFDTNKGLPEINDNLKIDYYEPGTEGLYLVDLMGPVNPEWRKTLEEKDVDIINYIPNYAYVARMTPEEAEEVEDLFFVDWVGIYQPEFKLAENIQPGLVSVTLSDGGRSIIAIEGKVQLIELANRNDVYQINQYYEPRLHDEMATQTVGGGLWIWDPEDDSDSAYRGHGDYGSLATQLGHDGEGVVVAVADTGIGDGTTSDVGHPDFHGRVIGGYDYESDSYEEGEWADGHGHGTHVAGSVAGHTHGGTEEKVYEDYYAAEGTAPGSELYAVKVFDDGGSWIAGDDYYDIVEIPKRAEKNTYVHTNSWGADTEGEYTASDEDFDRAVRDANRNSDENEPMIITVAAGNQGPGANSIGSPGNAKNVITVGSTGNYPYNSPEAVSRFSSRGWTNDNRVKPDVMAPGENVYSTEPGGGYGSKSGTSMATPAVAGAAASVFDWYESNYGTKPSPSMIRALLINTAYDLANEQEEKGENSPYIPNQDEGWGMVNLPNIVHTDVNIILVNEGSLIETGEVHEYEIEQDDDTEPLRISLTWTDAVPIVGIDGTLNNDLNLEIESPGGKIYRGNNLVKSWSEPGKNTYDTFDTNDDGWDDVNNVENIYLLPEDVEEGTYTVRVIGNDIPLDADNDGYANQDYSLVKWNAVESGSTPLSPSDPDPENGASGVPTDVELSVYVEHEDGDNMDVSFYDASEDTLVGEDNAVQSGERAYIIWEGLETRTEYQWYAVADDGTQTATLEIWKFTTEGESYTLTIDSTEGGEVIEPGEGTFEHEEGTVVDLEAVSGSGYEFVEWTGDVETVEETGSTVTTIEMQGDYAITAEFKEELEMYELTIDSTVGGEVIEPGEGTFEYEEGTVVDLEVIIASGYEFFEWTGDVETVEDTVSTVTNIEMQNDYVITAEFKEELKTYVLTIDSTEGGEVVKPGEGSFEYEEGTLVDLEAVSGSGYQFAEWTGDVVNADDAESALTTIEMLDSYTITAKFEEEPPERYDLTINISGEGSTDPIEGTHTYEEGTTISVEAIADEGWSFVNWTGDETGTDNIMNVTIDEDKTITAHFEEEYDDETSGFLSTHLLVGVAISVAIFYYKKKQERPTN